VVGSEIEKEKKITTNTKPNIFFAQAPSMNTGETLRIKMSL
jgi:hypothetical protein